MLYAKETRISSVRLGFWLVYAFTYLPGTVEQPRPRALRSLFYGKSPGDEVDC